MAAGGLLGTEGSASARCWLGRWMGQQGLPVGCLHARVRRLLSDGSPYRDNKHITSAEIMAVVDTCDKDRGIVIHTLGFKGADKTMMGELAAKTGGNYRDIPRGP